jgi:predicted short-subunit dehydrogenase-like oxidoreductase (DUF2520 family)
MATVDRSSISSVFILGAGKVGRALGAALKKAGVPTTLRAARRGLPSRPIDASLLVLAVRDRALPELVETLRARRLVSKKTAVVHCAGALDATPLAPLRGTCAGVAQMHPMISFASTTFFPTLERGNLHVQGDPVAVRRAAALGRKLGMTPRTFPRLDPVGYHAAAGLVANGAAALAAQGVAVLKAAGVPEKDAPKLLGPLLRSVAENVEKLGFPTALTGPVRRGDRAAIVRAAEVLAARASNVVPLYVAAVQAQLPLARALAEAPREAFDDIQTWLDSVQ